MFRFPFRSTAAPLSDRLDLECIETVLFDLDGTLIDIDMQRFIPAYLARLTRWLSEVAPPQRISEAMRLAVQQMLSRGSGEQTMEALLLEHLARDCAITPEQYREALASFVIADLPELESLIAGHPLATELLDTCLSRGWRPVLATNPIFPAPVVEARIRWGGIDPECFHLITTYENSRYCKPHPGYFREVLAVLDTTAEACLMIGNDTQHDLAATEVGLQTCLLTTWQVDRAGGRYRADWQGDHGELLTLLRA